MESFFKTLKIEWTKERKYTTQEQARSSVFEFIEVLYNRTRLHSTLNYLSPVDFERGYVA
ncbi:IS3 family transposase [Elusimicrobiota bacterium]